MLFRRENVMYTESMCRIKKKLVRQTTTSFLDKARAVVDAAAVTNL